MPNSQHPRKAILTRMASPLSGCQIHRDLCTINKTDWGPLQKPGTTVGGLCAWEELGCTGEDLLALLLWGVDLGWSWAQMWDDGKTFYSRAHVQPYFYRVCKQMGRKFSGERWKNDLKPRWRRFDPPPLGYYPQQHLPYMKGLPSISWKFRSDDVLGKTRIFLHTRAPTSSAQTYFRMQVEANGNKSLDRLYQYVILLWRAGARFMVAHGNVLDDQVWSEGGHSGMPPQVYSEMIPTGKEPELLYFVCRILLYASSEKPAAWSLFGLVIKRE